MRYILNKQYRLRGWYKLPTIMNLAAGSAIIIWDGRKNTMNGAKRITSATTGSMSIRLRL
jgi:hypothetical protein